MRFLLSYPCGSCDETVYVGPALTLLEHDGLPVVPASVVETTSYVCDSCGARSHVGDLDVLVEDDGSND